MALTIAQIGTLSNRFPDTRQLVGEIIKYLNDNPGGGATGLTGEQGIQGIPGIQGEQGEQGQPGIAGTSDAMTAGTVTVNTADVTAASKIFLSHAVPIGTLGWLTPGTIVDGVSFVINSTGATDLSTVNWLIIN